MFFRRKTEWHECPSTEDSEAATAGVAASAWTAGPVFATVAARGSWVPRVHGDSYAPGALLIGVRAKPGA